jgi:outer membrane cobalamin receptor
MMGRLLYSLYLNGIDQGQSARNMRRLSPSLSLSYRLLADKELFLRASLKNIFRVPTFNESYYFHYGSADLQSESANQLNIGITAQCQPLPKATVRATLDGYYNHVKDMIVAIPYNMFVWTCVNIGKVDVWGADATLQATHDFGAGHQLTAMGNLTLQHVENKTNAESPNYGKQIAYYPKLSGGASLSYENPFVNLGVHIVGMSDRWSTNEHLESTRVKGYQDAGITAWRDFVWGRHRFQVRGDLKNIFDKQYEIVRLYPMPGRSFQVSFNYK